MPIPEPAVMHPTLARLDDLARSLASDPAVLAVLGLGSAGVEHDRFDDHSDIDFFLVVADSAAKRRYLSHTNWLEGFGGSLACSFVPDLNGRKALLLDGLFLEYAVFTPAELASVPFTGERTIWIRPGIRSSWDSHPGPPVAASDSDGFHVGEALTNLFVGLHREMRGERLTAMRFIQVFAVDHVLSLWRRSQGHVSVHRDPFEPTRRVETATGPVTLPLSAMLAGYERNGDSALAVLNWLEEHCDVDAAMAEPIRALLKSCVDSTADSDQACL